MSAEWLFSRESQCTRKRRYPSKLAAKRALRSVKACGGDHLVIYHCAHCGGWHLGHKHPPRKGAA